MAKGAYIGIDSVARKIKKGYLGVEQEVPIYEETTTTISKALNNTNIDYFFTVSSETGTSAWTRSDASGGGLQLKPGNTGVNSSNAKITLTAKQALSSVKISGAYYTESTYDKITLIAAGTTVLNAVSGSSANAQRWTGSLAKDNTIVLIYAKDNSSHAANETNTAFTITCSNLSIQETTQTIVGYETKGIAHKIKKAYIGIGGVARPCWSGGELAYYGTAKALSVARTLPSATHVGDYALFGGGDTNNENYHLSDVVDAYNNALTRSTPTGLAQGRSEPAATYVGNYALFGGGFWYYAYGREYTGINTVDAYDTALTKHFPESFNYSLYGVAAIHIGHHALFCGGYYAGYDYPFMNWIEAYDESLTQSQPGRLNNSVCDAATAHVDDYALFGGGFGDESTVAESGKVQKIVTAFNSSLTRFTAMELSEAREGLKATSVGRYALFGGGRLNAYGTTTKVIDVYDASLTRSNPIELSAARSWHAATHLGEYAIFGGGSTDGDSSSKVVDAYDESLTHTIQTSLGAARSNLGATHVGNYALFGGGETSSGGLASTVYVYTIV